MTTDQQKLKNKLRLLVTEAHPDISTKDDSVDDLLEKLNPDSKHLPVLKTATEFHCLKLEMTLNTPCGLRECEYHVDYAPSDNCIMAHTERKGTFSLTQAEVSYMTQLHPTAVTRLMTRAMTKLRQAAAHQARDNRELLPQFVLKPNEHVCVVCESLIQEEPVHQDDQFTWCSQCCLDEVSPEEIKVEHTFGVSGEKMVTWLVNRFGSWDPDKKTFKQMAQTVGLDPPRFTQFFWRVKRQVAQRTLKGVILESHPNPDLSSLDVLEGSHPKLLKDLRKKKKKGSDEMDENLLLKVQNLFDTLI